LLPYYELYISEVSGDYMAISLEFSSFLSVFCDLMRPTSIADLGTGFSSFLFRNYAAQSEQDVKVWSVDDSPEWLEKTRGFLAKQGLFDGNMGIWDRFIEGSYHGFDLILHDLGSMDIRAKTLSRVLNLVRPYGFVLLDDIHITEYAPIAKKALRESGFKLYSLRHYTKDKFGRFASLATKRKGIPEDRVS
jgi:predicted O-methyltransferase YrrM